MSDQGRTERARLYRPDRVVLGRTGISRRWLGLILGLAVLVYAFVFGNTGWWVMRSERAQTAELRAQVEALNSRREALQERTDALRQPGGFELEKVARESYFMQRDDEEVVHIVGGESNPPEEESTR